MPRASGKVDRAPLVVSAALILVAGAIVWDAQGLPAVPYGMGPAATPIAIAVGLVALAAANAVTAWTETPPERDALDRAAVPAILGGLVALIAIIGLGGGFIPATAILFAATARAMGRRALVTDLVIGLVLGLLVYLLFAKLLALSLPAGPIEQLL